MPGFQPLEAYEVALQNLAPVLARRRVPDVVEFLGGRVGQPSATVEVAAAIGRSPRTIAGQLERLAADGAVERTPLSLGEWWHAN